MNKKEFILLVDVISDTEKLLGVVNYSLDEKKQKQRRFSRSLYVSKDIKKGEKFTLENVKSVRPGYGLHPKYLNDVLGKVALKDYKYGDRVEKNTF